MKTEARTITEVFERVEASVDEGVMGIVPIENSIEGPVHETLDNLFTRDRIYVNREIELRVEIVLAVNKALRNGKRVQRLYAQHYAYSEAKDKLRDLGVEIEDVIPVESTSKGAMLASKDPGGAALCSELAAKIYGLRVLYRNVQSTSNNITRFFLISKNMRKVGEKTLVFMTVPHKPGGLYKALGHFYRHRINLTMIYSRPLKSIPWRYYFYVEFEGSLSSRKVQKTIEELKEATELLEVKGSFTKSRSQYRA